VSTRRSAPRGLLGTTIPRGRHGQRHDDNENGRRPVTTELSRADRIARLDRELRRMTVLHRQAVAHRRRRRRILEVRLRPEPS